MKKKLLLLSTIATLALAICGCDSKDSGNSIVDNSEPTTTEATTEAGDISEQTEDAERGSVANGVFTQVLFMIVYSIFQICSQTVISHILA